jgi:hypothetical protein
MAGHIHLQRRNPAGFAVRSRFGRRHAAIGKCIHFEENAALCSIASTNHEATHYNLRGNYAKNLEVMQRLVALSGEFMSWRLCGTGTARNLC